MTRHRHDWYMEDPDRGWILARCSHCYMREAFPVGPINETVTCSRCDRRTFHRDQLGELCCITCGNRPAGPTIPKHIFLRSRGVRKRLTWEEMAPVVAYARKFGITAAARSFKRPLSTVGRWAKGQSPFRFGIRDYPLEFKQDAFALFSKLDRNFYATSKLTGIPRSTLQSWERSGVWRMAA